MDGIEGEKWRKSTSSSILSLLSGHHMNGLALPGPPHHEELKLLKL
jgi:hypothetical protein